MRLLIGVAAVGALVLGADPVGAQGYIVPSGTAANIKRAIESPARTEEQRAQDAARKRAEILTLAGIEDGDRVIEFASFGHYYTTLLVEAVGPSGHVHMVDMPWTEAFAGGPARALDAAHANATFTLVHFNRANLPRNIDVAMMVLFYHDLKAQSGESFAQYARPIDQGTHRPNRARIPKAQRSIDFRNVQMPSLSTCTEGGARLRSLR